MYYCPPPDVAASVVSLDSLGYMEARAIWQRHTRLTPEVSACPWVLIRLHECLIADPERWQGTARGLLLKTGLTSCLPMARARSRVHPGTAGKEEWLPGCQPELFAIVQQLERLSSRCVLPLRPAQSRWSNMLLLQQYLAETEKADWRLPQRVSDCA